MMKKIAEGTAVLQDYAVYELSGVVRSENTRSETSVSGHIPAGNRNRGGTISSKTTRFQTIYFKGENGKEDAVELVDLIIPCTEGHQLTLWGVNKGSWFEWKNHTTDQSAISKSPLTNFTMPIKTIKRAFYVVVILLFSFFVFFASEVSVFSIMLCALGAFFLGAISFLLFLVPGKIVSVIRSKQILFAKNKHASS